MTHVTVTMNQRTSFQKKKCLRVMNYLYLTLHMKNKKIILNLQTKLQFN